ncbi:stage II sporulation protein SpoIID [Clostridia bacterium]|nr:stage II sporulation protein SpoIID [Clostridia bacterium]
MKVGLRYGVNAQTSCTLESSGGFILGTIEGGVFQEGLPLLAYTKVNILLSGRYAVISADGVLISDDFGVSNCIMPYNYLEDGVIRYEGASYRGGMSFFVNSNNTLNVINCLGIEQYLYGVISGEIGRSSPAEALKAQAVVSRSYAVKKEGNHKNDGFDLCSTGHCQVYKGYGGEYAETNGAVDETAGLVLLNKGEPVAGYYYKNSGGHTQNSEDVWNNTEDYLRGVVDEFSPDYPWTWRSSFREIRTALTGTGNDPGDISSVEISKRNSYGSVLEMKIKGSRTTVTLSKEQIRNVLGFNNIKSPIFSLGGFSSGEAGASTGAGGGTELFATNGPSASKVSGKIFVLSGEGAAVSKEVGELRVEGSTPGVFGGEGQDSQTLDKTGDTSVKGLTASEIATSDPVVFSGKGYGHGVGLPQDSAIEMAKKGYDYAAILEKYYTGIQVGVRLD